MASQQPPPGQPPVAELQGMHLGSGGAAAPPPSAYYYPAVPGVQGPPPPPPPAHVGSGWTAEAVQPAAAVPGQAHYGHLQHAPSFNTAAAAAGGAPPHQAAAGPPGGPSYHAPEPPSLGAPAQGGWVLDPALARPPSADLTGPFVRYNDHDPASGAYAVSVLVVSSPALAGATVQLHWGVDGPAMAAAPGSVLDEFMGHRFWRFDLELQLRDSPARVNYLVGLVGGQAPLASHQFHLPARGQPWRWMFYSCNGFHEAEPERKYGGIANLWRDVQERHAYSPFHLQVGGGDQLYCDHVLDLPSLKPWLAIDDPQVRSKEPFTPRQLLEAEQFYFGHYCKHFSDPALAPALASIPFHFSWDDHDLFDGWGSYPDYLQQSAVFQGLFAVARRFYLLFQQHCRYDNAAAASKTMGEYSYHMVRNIGPGVILMSPDTRSERTIHQVLPPGAWDLLFNEVTRRIQGRPLGAVTHLVVLLPVPIVYPKVPVTETLLAAISKGMASQKPVREWVAKLNLPSSAVSVFHEPDLLDDLLDHWTSSDHMREREMLVRRLQSLASAYSVRVTFTSGDVHVGGFGCFQAHPKEHVRVIDPRFMLQVISSAIGNEPPPAGVIAALETVSMASTAMGDTLDKMIKAFPDRRKLRAARNYCEVATLMEPRACDATGAPQPPGGLAFTLRIEAGAPGRPTGIELATQVAPVLLTGPRAGEAAPYAAVPAGAVAVKGQLAEGLKTVGHKLSNFLARV